MSPAGAVTPGLDAVRATIVGCASCPRLRRYCQRVAREKKAVFRGETYWGRPVPGFGDPAARVLVVGLAPAAHGANRTGRVFTGDGSGDFLMSAMSRAGFANLPTSRHPQDGLALTDAYILAAVRCAPPDNKPTPLEIARCRRHLAAEMAALPQVRVLVALGRIAFDAVLSHAAELGLRVRPRPRFGHGCVVTLPAAPGQTAPWTVLGSYHPSRQNTNTGKLTAPMLESVFHRARQIVDGEA